MKQFDAIVIGSGQAGTPLAKKLAEAGMKTALIEKRWIGGTCVNDGCTPTKSMIASARMAFMARKSATLGINLKDVSVDLPAIVDRKNKIVSQFRNGSLEGLQKVKNLEIVFGNAHFTGVKQLLVIKDDGTEETLAADLVFINTGASPGIPPIPGLADITYLTSTTILDLTVIPEHLLILGGGYVGLEFGQMFNRFGSKVTLLDTNETLLKREDRDIADCLCSILQNEGMTLHCKALVNKFEKGSKEITALITVDGKPLELACSHVLLAAGRTPQTKDLQLSLTGVTTNEKGFIQVNEHLETNQPGIYALGDVKGGPAFTHISYNDHLVVYKNIVEKAGISIKDRMVPYCMFTDPQLGRIGITEAEAKKKGIEYKVATLGMNKVARGIETGETLGMMKAIVDVTTKQILGAAIIGEQGGEVMSVIQMAMMGNFTYEQIRDGIFAHPLYAESLNNLFFNLK
ncbi:MAG: mercuric reductase [Chitinophagaceae bacterium]|nr:mercuric reductase [Chitinophagaceae bacterium]